MNLHALVVKLSQQLNSKNLQVTVAESCTGGGLAGVLTSIAGSSAWFDRGFVTYSNAAKHEMLGVSKLVIESHGAVSQDVAEAMALGAIQNSNANLSVAITGIAGPGGGSEDKPVGTVWIAVAGAYQEVFSKCYQFSGDREAIRNFAMQAALLGLIERVAAYNIPSTESVCYFFALMPDETTKQALYKQACIVASNLGLQPVAADKLHVTLNYLGPITESVINYLDNITCSLPSFKLEIKQACFHPQANMGYLKPKASRHLLNLHNFLKQQLLKCGIKPERRDFMPHVTFIRNCPTAFKTLSFAGVSWDVRQLYLMQSQPGGSASNLYKTIKIINLFD